MPQEKDLLELELFEANSFMGISKSHPIVIDFTGKRKNQNVVEFFGDQGQCKTSTLCGILYAMGATFSLDKKKLMNSTDGAIDVNLKFTYNEEQYHVIAKSNRIDLKKLNDDTGKWSPVDSPVAMLRSIFGPVGMSPFSVKELRGKDQIKFFQDMFGSGEDASKKIQKLEADIDTLFSQRRDINRDAKALSASLELEPLFQNYEKSQQRFKTTVSAEKEKKAFEALAEQHKQYEKAEATLSTLEDDIMGYDMEIELLREKLAAAEKNRTEAMARKEKGEKWIADNKDIPKKYEAAQKEWMNLSQVLADQEKWKTILKREKELIEIQDAATTATGQLDELNQKLLKAVQSCLPKVDGLSIKVATGLDKADKPEGVFYNDKPIHELSESEYVDLWCKIWDAAGVSHIFIENISSLGSGAVATLNQIAKNGGMVFATRMERKQKEMTVAFKGKID